MKSYLFGQTMTPLIIVQPVDGVAVVVPHWQGCPAWQPQEHCAEQLQVFVVAEGVFIISWCFATASAQAAVPRCLGSVA